MASSTEKNNGSPPWSAAIDRLKLQKRICSKFIPRETNKKYCVCNRLMSTTHPNTNPSGHTNEVWNLKDHTTTIPANSRCYGILPQSNSPYLRCDIKTDLDQLCLVLLGVWGMHVPNLILRVMSDSSSTLNIKLEREMLRGISDAAMASDACIITSGYKEDTVSQLIGEVVYKSRVKNPEINFRAIGVGKWGNIREWRTVKERHNDNDIAQNERTGRYTLEPNLTHYIFFDDGTRDSIDNGKFASNLANRISRGARRKIPLVTVLIGAELYALEFIYNDLKNGIPVVIVDQSGPLANLMCKYLKLTESETLQSLFIQSLLIIDIFKSTNNQIERSTDRDENNINEDIDTHILKHSFEGKTLDDVLNKFINIRLDIFKELRKLYGSLRHQEYADAGKKLPVGELLNLAEERTLAKYLFWFGTCLSSDYRAKIHVFDLNSSNPFQNKIYDALVQARENLSQISNKRAMTADDQMSLALRWSIADVNEGHSFSSAMDWKDANKIKEHRKLIFDALGKNLQVFVSNFVKLGIDFSVLFAPTTDRKQETGNSPWSQYLKELYSDKIRKNTDSLYLLDKIKKKFTFKEEIHLTNVLRILIGDFMKPIYAYEPSSTWCRVTPEKTEERTESEYIYRDLFLWCVLTHRLDMAKIFLGQMKTRICSALIASKILKSLSVYAPDHDSKDKLCLEADDFETYAIECIRCSYFYDHEQACELIMRRVDLYGEVTCLQMAVAADDKKFLYEDTCDALLTNIWYDKVDPAQELDRLVVNLLTMGISQFFFSIHDKRQDKVEAKRSGAKTSPSSSIKRPIAKHGINYTDDYLSNERIYKHFLHFHNRPIVKYCYTCFGYILFLLFFSYFMLYAFDPTSSDTPDIHWTEILTIIFVTTMLFEEVRQFFFQDDWSFKSKLLTYFDLNNRSSNLFLVLPAYLLFYVGLILRFVLNDSITFSAARIVMAYDLELWFIRSVLFIGIAPSLGPKLVMIRKMTNDLLFFVFLIMIVIFGYGITSRAMTAYGTFGFDGRQFFLNVVYPVYYFVLGSFDSERTNLEAAPDASTTIATQVMFAFHMLFVNILLVNLLIALFTFTIDNVQEQAKYIWAYDRCSLIRDYYARPALFPPFTCIISIGEFCKWCYQGCHRNAKDAQMIPFGDNVNNVDNAWSEFERYSTNDYVRRLLDAQSVAASSTITTDVASEILPTSSNESRRLKSDINNLNDGLIRTRIETGDKLLSVESIVVTLRDRVEQIDTRLDKVIDSLEWMMSAMVRVKMAKTDPPSFKQKPRMSIANQGRQEPADNGQDNRRSSKRNSALASEQVKQETSKDSDIRIRIPNRSSDDEDD